MSKKNENMPQDGPGQPQPLTNVEMITKFLTQSSQMNQIMMIHAMDSYAAWVLNHQDEIRAQWSTSFIHPESWIQAAKEWHELVQARIQANVAVRIIVITE